MSTPSDKAIADLFQFETIIARAACAVLEDAKLTSRAVGDSPTFQGPRPRADVMFHCGGNSMDGGRIQYATPNMELAPTDFPRPRAWFGTLRVQAITDVSQPGTYTHALYVAKVRCFCGTLGSQINAQLPKHQVNFVREGECNWGINTEKGYEISDFNFDVTFSIRTEAWKELYQ